MDIRFTVYGKPEPQGSTRAFIPRGWKRPVITSANRELKTFRQEVSKAALLKRQSLGYATEIFGKHEPVEAEFTFVFLKPPSTPKKRNCHVVKPDADKLLRSATDALAGILYVDDAQIVKCMATKLYGSPERTEITVRSASREWEQQTMDKPVNSLAKEPKDNLTW